MFFGLQHFIHGDFVTRVMPPWPGWIPARTAGVYASGTFLIATGIAMLITWKIRLVAAAFALVVLLAGVLLRVPPALSDWELGIAWTQAGKILALGGGGLAVMATVPTRQRDDLLLLASRCLLGGFFIVSGVQHFVWLQFVNTLVPSWIPGATFWTCFAGVALVAAGVGLIVPRSARLAAWWSGIMVFMWVWVLHVPRALADLSDANETTAVFEALAVCGIAFLHAALTRPTMPPRDSVSPA